MSCMRIGIAVLIAVAAVLAPPAAASTVLGLPGAWTEVRAGPDGGSVWQGRIPDAFAPSDRRASAVYLPPGFSTARRYPVIYLLHGMRGDPAEYWDALRLANVADTLIASGRAAPFIAVIPVAGPRVNPDTGEWAGAWERYLVDGVVPWADAHLPTLAAPQDRALEGLCAGGFGAVDIGLRHPRLFGTLGSWEGYFAPVFRDGPFASASPADLAAHDPSLLAVREAAQLRREGMRFYLSAGGNHGAVLRRYTLAFAGELRSLGLRHELWLLPRSERGHFWRATLPSALTYAATGFTTYP
jgi:putative esterase